MNVLGDGKISVKVSDIMKSEGMAKQIKFIKEIIMKKPHENAFKLYNLGRIKGLYLHQKQTGTDTTDTFASILGSQGDLQGVLWSDFSEFLDVQPWYDGIAKLKSHITYAVEQWNKYESENKEEYNEFLRLRAKYDRDS